MRMCNFRGSSDLRGEEGVEEGPVGFAGVEECADSVVPEVAESEAEARGTVVIGPGRHTAAAVDQGDDGGNS